ncbi:MAG: hypothetical protein AAF772_13115 [Acidobacteriota bacterium]
MADYLAFPPASTVLRQLRSQAESRDLGMAFAHDELYRSIAERLGGRTYEGAAFAFILFEMIYEVEEDQQQDLSSVLRHCILALTENPALASDALRSFDEIKHSMLGV